MAKKWAKSGQKWPKTAENGKNWKKQSKKMVKMVKIRKKGITVTKNEKMQKIAKKKLHW